MSNVNCNYDLKTVSRMYYLLQSQRPGKNNKYLKKHKLDIEFQILFLFNSLLRKIHSDIKMLYNFGFNIMYKIFKQKEIYSI